MRHDGLERPARSQSVLAELNEALPLLRLREQVAVDMRISGNSSSRFDTRVRHTSLSFVHMNPGPISPPNLLASSSLLPV